MVMFLTRAPEKQWKLGKTESEQVKDYSKHQKERKSWKAREKSEREREGKACNGHIDKREDVENGSRQSLNL